MARSYDDKFIPLLKAAMEEEIGLYIEVDDKEKLQRLLYDLRKDREEFAELTFVCPTVEGREGVLFIAKKTTELVD